MSCSAICIKKQGAKFGLMLSFPLKELLLVIFWLAAGTSASFAQDDLIRDTIQTKVELIRDQIPSEDRSKIDAWCARQTDQNVTPPA